MLSVSCKAGLKAVVLLASQTVGGKKISLAEIAMHIDSNEHTIGKIMQQLVRNNIVKSSKGPGGGFYITTEQMTLPLIKIVESIDGTKIFEECGLGLSTCSSQHPCPIHFEYKKARDLYEQIFRTSKIADLCKPVKSKTAFLT